MKNNYYYLFMYNFIPLLVSTSLIVSSAPLYKRIGGSEAALVANSIHLLKISEEECTPLPLFLLLFLTFLYFTVRFLIFILHCSPVFLY